MNCDSAKLAINNNIRTDFYLECVVWMLSNAMLDNRDDEAALAWLLLCLVKESSNVETLPTIAMTEGQEHEDKGDFHVKPQFCIDPFTACRRL